MSYFLIIQSLLGLFKLTNSLIFVEDDYDGFIHSVSAIFWSFAMIIVFTMQFSGATYLGTRCKSVDVALAIKSVMSIHLLAHFY
jgi:predicted CDP-diglyceride synthetase/phosphatidate cytidylyltransferase